MHTPPSCQKMYPFSMNLRYMFVHIHNKNDTLYFRMEGIYVMLIIKLMLQGGFGATYICISHL